MTPGAGGKTGDEPPGFSVRGWTVQAGDDMDGNFLTRRAPCRQRQQVRLIREESECVWLLQLIAFFLSATARR